VETAIRPYLFLLTEMSGITDMALSHFAVLLIAYVVFDVLSMCRKSLTRIFLIFFFTKG